MKSPLPWKYVWMAVLFGVLGTVMLCISTPYLQVRPIGDHPLTLTEAFLYIAMQVFGMCLLGFTVFLGCATIIREVIENWPWRKRP